MKQILLISMWSFIANLCNGQADVIINTMLDPTNNLEQIIDIDSMKREEAEADWEQSYRTSDEAGEKSTNYSFDVVHAPEGAVRIGCICMEGTSMDLKGTGACSGYGGVRFWIYKLKNGDDFLLPTDRHKAHPEALSDEEAANLSSRNKRTKYGNAYNGKNGGGLSWEELMAVLAICVTIAFITRTIWGSRNNRNDELHY